MKHMVFCGVPGSGKSTQAHRLMNLLFEEKEWKEVIDNKNINIHYLVKNHQDALIDECKDVKRISWLIEQIKYSAEELEKPFSVVFITQDIEGVSRLDRKIFRVLECVSSKTKKGVFKVKSLNN